jgi:hypothetical protein
MRKMSSVLDCARAAARRGALLKRRFAEFTAKWNHIRQFFVRLAQNAQTYRVAS